MFGGVACLFFLCSSCCYLVKSLTNLKYYPRRQCNDSRQMALDIRDQTQQTNFIQTPCSLRADEIKLWLTPSAKQRRNPCSGLPAVYPDLSTRHDWPVKKGFVLFVVIANQVEGEFEMHFR